MITDNPFEVIAAQLRSLQEGQEQIAARLGEIVATKEIEEPADTLYDTRMAAKFLGLRPGTLGNDRVTRRMGIPYEKKGRSVRYRLGDLRKYRSKSVRKSTCDPG